MAARAVTSCGGGSVSVSGSASSENESVDMSVDGLLGALAVARSLAEATLRWCSSITATASSREKTNLEA